MELFSVQRHIRDFYFKEALAAPDSVAHVHKPGLVPDQRLFSVADLRRHLNNLLLDLNYLNFFLAGKPVDLSEARAYKVVQRRRIEFVDIRVLEKHLAEGRRACSKASTFSTPRSTRSPPLWIARMRRHSAMPRFSSRSVATRLIGDTSTPTMCW
jgi:hypothetical protein